MKKKILLDIYFSNFKWLAEFAASGAEHNMLQKLEI